KAIELEVSRWQYPVAHGRPSYVGAVSVGSLGPVWFVIVRRAVASRRAARSSGSWRRTGFAEITSAATPRAFGADIDVPWSQPKPAPSALKHAKLKSEDWSGSRQISPLASSAPSEPQPP